MEDIMKGEKDPCESWKALKCFMRARFVPPSYTRDLHNKSQRLYQGSRSVEEYHKEMGMNLMRDQIRESEEATLAWFLHGLNTEIQDVELKHCKNLSDLIHQAIKVEMQIKRNNAYKKTYVGSSGWKGKEKEKDRARMEKSFKKGSEPSIGRKELTPIPTHMPSRASNIKCFKCLDKGHITSQYLDRRVMIVKDDGEIGSKSSIGEVRTSSEFESLSDGSHYEGNLLMVMRFMNSHVGEKAETQRENIFHSRWGVVSMYVNVASERLVKRLALPTIVHPRPYRLQWLSEKEELLVDKKAKVIKIGLRVM
ncbi:hypothetical protein CR513_11573, partial [Mucuna pruriens]